MTDQVIASDRAARSTDIHWPEGVSPATADMFAHNEIHVEAPVPIVWNLLLAAEDWPRWYPNSHEVKVLTGTPERRLAPGAQFSWQTFGLDIVSEIHEFEPESRLGWFGGTDWYHTWLLTPTESGCHVIMEEAGQGDYAATMSTTTPDRMHRGHELWNQCLKWAAEEAAQNSQW